jgi:hypothetical protein
MLLPTQRWKHFAAMVLIGDGVMAIVHPQRDAAAWKLGPRPWRSAMQALRQRPALTRVIGVTQIAAGIGWALYQQRASDHEQDLASTAE